MKPQMMIKMAAAYMMASAVIWSCCWSMVTRTTLASWYSNMDDVVGRSNFSSSMRIFHFVLACNLSLNWIALH